MSVGASPPGRPSVLVFGQRELESKVARGEVPAPYLVSIVEPRRPFRRAREDERTPSIFRRAFREVLTLHFSDVPEGTAPEFGSWPPSRADARRIVRFARARAGEGGFAVHCWAGICRSAAAAMGILHVLGRSEEEALRDLLSVRPYARPHPGLLAHFDALLGSPAWPRSPPTRAPPAWKSLGGESGLGRGESGTSILEAGLKLFPVLFWHPCPGNTILGGSTSNPARTSHPKT